MTEKFANSAGGRRNTNGSAQSAKSGNAAGKSRGNEKRYAGGKPKSGGTAGSRRPVSGGKSYGGTRYPASSGPDGKSNRATRSPRPTSRPADRTPEFDPDLMAEAAAAVPDVLSKAAQAELANLGGMTEKVSAHLAAAYLVLPEDPAEALRHAKKAKDIAARLGCVREAYGVVAYHAGKFDIAVTELRAARRIGGNDDVVPLIADCERALGHPEKALEIAAQPVHLAPAERLELRLVAAGARMDLGQPEAAALLLRIPLLDSDASTEESARIKYVYAEAMLAAGDVAEAIRWFQRAAEADTVGATDAGDRARELQMEEQ